jgi:hypothetical protein
MWLDLSAPGNRYNRHLKEVVTSEQLAFVIEDFNIKLSYFKCFHQVNQISQFF